MRDLSVIVTVAVVSAVAGVGVLVWPRAPGEGGDRQGSSWRRIVAHPLTWFAGVCGLLFVNQILFNAHVVAAHGGDPGFVARYTGPGWFALAPGDPLVRAVVRHAGDGRDLAFTVLRAQAFLELPFVLAAYLAIARLLDRGIFRRLVFSPLLWLASASFSLTFSVVELWLRNPYTVDDLVLRAASALVTPAAMTALAWSERRRKTEEADRPRDAFELLAFLIGAGSLACVVLGLYDAFLLYNLAHLEPLAPILVAASAVALPAQAWRLRTPRVSSAFAEALARSLGAFTLLFFVPSLAIRYAFSCPEAWTLAAGLAALGFLGGLRGARPGAVVALVACASVGAGGAWCTLSVTHAVLHRPLAELDLLVGAVGFLVSGGAAGALIEVVSRSATGA